MEKQQNKDSLFLSDKQRERTKRGVEIIDRVVNEIVLPYSTMSNNKVMLSFARIFADRDDDLVAHYLDKFIHNSNKDWGLYMLNADCGIVRGFFEYFSIPIEEDKITDEVERIKAQIFGKDKFEIFPFEYEITRRFYLFANNHSLDDVDKWTDYIGIKDILLKKKINLYGNGLNWSKAWNCFAELAKESFICSLLEKE